MMEIGEKTNQNEQVTEAVLTAFIPLMRSSWEVECSSISASGELETAPCEIHEFHIESSLPFIASKWWRWMS